ncbi:MAG: folate-binding protein YgfZ [Rubrivivax sp.]|nr:folate-binding protein YgfZ [Rubrivivax sp.]
MIISRMSAFATPTGVAALSDWGLIQASGDDARSFLHGQLTQDVLHLEPGRAALAGYCSAKGRLLATFVAWLDGEGNVMLACSRDLLPAVLKRLSMFVLRAKCRLADVSGRWSLDGVVGDPCTAALRPWQVQTQGSGQLVALPPALGLDGRLTHRALHLRAADALAWPGPALPLPAWHALEARAGVPRVVAATVEQFVPQMVNLELVGGVNFQKGCYPGQEVVARSQYRGTLKRRAYLVRSTVPLSPGQELVHSADPGQPAGLVVLAGELGDGRWDALVELKIAATEGSSLHLGAADGPVVELASLPYALPAEAAA